MPETVVLAPRVDTGASEALRGELLKLAGRDVTLDASAVEQIGGLGLEILLTAAHVWRAGGKALQVADPSDALLADLAHLGAAIETISSGGTE